MTSFMSTITRKFSSSLILTLVLAVLLPIAAQAECTCTCTIQTAGGPVTQAIPSIVGEGTTLAEARGQCNDVCEAESTRRSGTSFTSNFAGCPAGTFGSESESSPSETSGDTAGSGDAGSVALYNPLGANLGVAEFISRGIRMFIGLIGGLALIMFVYGGVMWMTAGDSKRVDTAKEILKNSTIGLLLIFFSYSIVSIVFGFLASA